MELNPADDTFARHLQGELPEHVIKPIEPRYLEEPRGRYQGQCGILAAPETTEQVSSLLKLANHHRVPVVPYGGGTGLVGGQVMPDGPAPLLISLERMTAIRAVYPDENVLIADAGAILSDIQGAADAVDRLFPLSLASEGSARIGGNLSTNAGGVNVLRYGNTRDLCLGLKVVLPDGAVWNGLSRLRKDNTGYDLRNLMIGAEGTLGVITCAALKLSPKPSARGTGVFVVPSPGAALKLLALVRDHVGEAVSAFELIHRQGLEFLTETLPNVRQPFETPPEWCVLIELGLAGRQDAETTLTSIFEAGLGEELVSDGVIAQSNAQRDELWSVREHIPEANRLIGSVSSHDISLPLGRVAEFIERARAEVAQIADFRINCFGHLGDGNLHFNVFPLKGQTRAIHDDKKAAVQETVHALVARMEGSVSAEHGVGRLKTDDIERYGDPVKLDLMKRIKRTLDPNGIMNPGAVLKL
jgi:FAD/FMN-containing dehydrogenase